MKDQWTIEEDIKLVKLFQQIGPKWTILMKEFPGRNDYQIKNRYNQSLKRRIEKGEFKKYEDIETVYPLTEQESECDNSEKTMTAVDTKDTTPRSS